MRSKALDAYITAVAREKGLASEKFCAIERRTNVPASYSGEIVDRSLRNQRAPVRYRTEGGGESARGTGIEAPLLQFSFCPLLSLLPLSSRLERPRCAEKEGAPKFLLLFRSRKSRKRAAQKLLPESWCGARLFTRRTHSLAHLTRLRPPRPPPLTPRPPLLRRRRSGMPRQAVLWE